MSADAFNCIIFFNILLAALLWMQLDTDLNKISYTVS